MYAFVGIDNDGRLRLTDEWCDLQMPYGPGSENKSVGGNESKGTLSQLFSLKQQHRHIKTLVSVGGWGTEHLFRGVMADSRKVEAFVESVVGFILQYGFDGVDIDWEYPTDNREYVELLSRLKHALKAVDSRLLLTVASPAAPEHLRVLDLPAISRLVSFFNVMCYDFAGSWSQSTDYHANLFGGALNGAGVMDYYVNAGVRPDQLVMGIPLYARVFHGVRNPGVGQPFTTSDVLDYNKLPFGQEGLDPKRVAAYCHDGDRFAVYDNDYTVRAKASHVRSRGFRGVMWWDSAGDKEEGLVGVFADFVGDLDRTENIIDIYKR